MTGVVLAACVIVGLVANALRLRARVPPVLPAAATSPPGNWAVIASKGVTLDEAIRRDATTWATAERLDLVDLVPADLPATAARDLLRGVDPGKYRSDRLAPGRGAGLAVLIAQPLLDRAGRSRPDRAGRSRPDRAGRSRPDRAGRSRPDRPEPADLIAMTHRIKPYAAADGAAIAVAPDLRSPRDDLAKRSARLRANRVIVPVHLALDAIPYALIVAALLTAWPWGLAAAFAYCLQPYLIFAGTPLRPRGRHAAALLRPVHAPYVWLLTAAGRWRSAVELERDAELAAAAAWYRAALAEGTARFLAPRRPDCPWCGSAEVKVMLRIPDLVKHKPGLFTLERCAGCGHVFQNPPLTREGLNFYYRDVYDGLGAADAESVFVTAGESYRGRANLVKPFTTPKAWLDVGAGHGHFCATAQQVWPDTMFDGLDMGAEIEAAQRRGWIATGYRGTFPELAADLAGRYDVVSMHHYLEHTTDPLAELDAAALILPSGGYLLIEVPDPQWPLARLFGRYWMPWFQPQHLHMMPLGNLTRALAERGLQPVAVERGAAHIANDFATAALLFFSRLAPDRTMPWSPRPPTVASRLWRGLVWTTALPVIVAGLLLDRIVRALARRWDRGTAYRILARREDLADAP